VNINVKNGATRQVDSANNASTLRINPEIQIVFILQHFHQRPSY
jgi:hypothetical protein